MKAEDLEAASDRNRAQRGSHDGFVRSLPCETADSYSGKSVPPAKSDVRHRRGSPRPAADDRSLRAGDLRQRPMRNAVRTGGGPHRRAPQVAGRITTQ